MKEFLFDLIRSCFDIEISNEFSVSENEITIELANGTKMKIVF